MNFSQIPQDPMDADRSLYPSVDTHASADASGDASGETDTPRANQPNTPQPSEDSLGLDSFSPLQGWLQSPDRLEFIFGRIANPHHHLPELPPRLAPATTSASTTPAPLESYDRRSKSPIPNPLIGISGGSAGSTTQKTVSGFTYNKTLLSETSLSSHDTKKKPISPNTGIVPDIMDSVPDAEYEKGEFGPAPAEETGDVASDEDVPPGDDIEERLTNPREYFRKLELLEESIYRHSAMHFQLSSSPGSQFRMPCPEYSILEHEDEELFQLLQTGAKFLSTEDVEGAQFHLRHIRNILLSVYTNLIRLRRNGFCVGFISLIVMDMKRPDQVAKLIPFALWEVRRLVAAFCSWDQPDDEAIHKLNTRCKHALDLLGLYRDDVYELLRPSGLHPFDSNFTKAGSEAKVKLWYMIANTLDVAVLSYAGAHIEPFDETYLGARTKLFKIPGPFQSSGQRQRLSSIREIHLRRRSLQCLDRFLRRDVWVFHLDKDGYEDQKTDRLFLSTDIITFADIWGPLWKSTRSSMPDAIYELNVGNGTIQPWPHDTIFADVHSRYTDEVYCHWVSWRDPLPDIDLVQQYLANPYFKIGDKLLIGAPPTSNFDFRLNENCQRSVEKIKQDLKDIHALNHLKTARRARFKDSQSVQVSGGGLGLSVGTTTTWKRREGQTWKDALVERWRDPERLNPVPLGYYGGLEVSLCTKNARRVRLLDVLRTKTMQVYLKGIAFAWEKGVEDKYFKALRSPNAFHRLWKVHKFRKNIGDAISHCLDALAETGVNDDTGELHALWVLKMKAPDIDMNDRGEDSSSASESSSVESNSEEPGDRSAVGDWEATEEYVMSLFRSEHTWTRFVKDTRDILTMAIVEDNCLECSEEYGRRCTAPYIAEDGKLVRWTNGYPVLQTGLQINERLLNNEGIEKVGSEGTQPYWDISNTKRKTRFLLGDQGVLKVFDNPNSSSSSRKGKQKMSSQATGEVQPLVAEWYGVKSDTLQEVRDVDIQQTFYGLNPKEHHTEYISTAFQTRPIPVFILSNSTKIARLGSIS